MRWDRSETVEEERAQIGGGVSRGDSSGEGGRKKKLKVVIEHKEQCWREKLPVCKGYWSAMSREKGM